MNGFDACDRNWRMVRAFTSIVIFLNCITAGTSAGTAIAFQLKNVPSSRHGQQMYVTRQETIPDDVEKIILWDSGV